MAFEAAFLAGLTEFLIERGKADLALSGLNLLYGAMNGNPTVSELLGRTMQAISQDTPVDPKIYLASVRSAVLTDLDRAPLKLAELLKEKGAGPAVQAFVVLSRPLEEIRDGRQPLLAFADLADERHVDKIESDYLEGAFRLIGVASREVYFGIVSGSPEDTPLKSIGAYLKDPAAAAIALAMLADKADDVTCIPFEEAQLVQLVEQMEEIVARIPSIEAEVGTVTAEKQFAAYLSATSALIPIIRDIIGVEVEDKKLSKIVAALESVVRLQQALIRKDYASLILTATSLIEDHYRLRPDEWQKTVQYLMIGANFAEAETPEQMYAMLVSFAAPPRTFAAKRKITEDIRGKPRRIHVMLNGFIGLSAGTERPIDTASDGSVPDGKFFGAFAPVGMEVSMHLKPPVLKWLGMRSLGVLFSPIDLGTYASFRLNGLERVEDSPDYSFVQALSPGAFITLGFTENIPIVFGFGAQFTPNLRKVTSATGSEKDISLWRYGIFTAVDIPLWIFR